MVRNQHQQQDRYLNPAINSYLRTLAGADFRLRFLSMAGMPPVCGESPRGA